MINKIRELVSSDSNSLGSKTILAAFWSFIGSAGGGVIRFVSNLILTRLLFPEAFGLMATAMVVINLVQLFSDTGVKTALIQNPRGGEKEFINTSFIIANLRSVILFIIVLIVSKPLANLYGQAELSSILLIMSGALIAEGMLNPALPLIIKSLRIEKQVVYAVGSQFAGFIFTVILVFYLRTVTALAIGYLLTSVCRVIGSYLVIRYKPELKWNKEAGRELINFGRVIIINTMLGWAVVNVDRLIIGKVLGMELLGYYNLALYIGLFAVDVLIQVFAQSFFPALSSIAGDLKRVQEIYTRTMTTVIALATPAMILLVIFSEEVITILYDPRYAMAGVALYWIGLKSVFHVISSLQSSTMLALGKPIFISISNFIGLLFLGIGLPLFTKHYGLVGSGIAVLISTLLVALIQSIFLKVKFNFKTDVIVKPWFHLFALMGLITAVYFLIKYLLRGFDSTFLLIVVTSIATAGVVYLDIIYFKIFQKKNKPVILDQ